MLLSIGTSYIFLVSSIITTEEKSEVELNLKFALRNTLSFLHWQQWWIR